MNERSLSLEIGKMWQLSKVCQALFFDERPVHKRYFLRIDTDRLEKTGLLKRKGDYFEALMRLHRIKDVFIVTDLASYTREDQVFPLHPENYYFLDTMEIKPGMEVLDLGTGSGIFAIVAAKNGARVLAIEKNPRAYKYAELNMGINGVEMELRHADYFDWSKKNRKRFDYIMSNPPFEPAPKELVNYYTHSFAGEDGLEMVRRQLDMFPQLLNPGGILQMVFFSVSSARDKRIPKILDEIDDRFAGRKTFSYRVEYSAPIALETFGKRFEKKFLRKQFVQNWLKRSTENVFIGMLFIQDIEDLEKRYNKWMNPADIDGIGQETPMGYKPKLHSIALD